MSLGAKKLIFMNPNISTSEESLTAINASLVAPVTNSPFPETISLESACDYACRVSDDHESMVISHMLMTQYMKQGLCNPQLSSLILNIPERRKQIRWEEEWNRHHPRGTLNTSSLPSNLRTPAALEIWQVLFTESMVDEDCQTLRSRTESGLMAEAIARKLGIRNVWKTFEEFWGMRNLKSAHDKALDYQSCWDFKKRLDELIL